MSRSTRGQLLLLASGHKVAVNKLSGLPNPQLSSLSKDAEEQHVWAPGTVGARADTRAVDEKPAVELPPELVLLKKMFGK